VCECLQAVHHQWINSHLICLAAYRLTLSRNLIDRLEDRVCLLLNGTSALFRLFVPRIVVYEDREDLLEEFLLPKEWNDRQTWKMCGQSRTCIRICKFLVPLMPPPLTWRAWSWTYHWSPISRLLVPQALILGDLYTRLKLQLEDILQPVENWWSELLQIEVFSHTPGTWTSLRYVGDGSRLGDQMSWEGQTWGCTCIYNQRSERVWIDDFGSSKGFFRSLLKVSLKGVTGLSSNHKILAAIRKLPSSILAVVPYINTPLGSTLLCLGRSVVLWVWTCEFQKAHQFFFDDISQVMCIAFPTRSTDHVLGEVNSTCQECMSSESELGDTRNYG